MCLSAAHSGPAGFGGTNFGATAVERSFPLRVLSSLFNSWPVNYPVTLFVSSAIRTPGHEQHGAGDQQNYALNEENDLIAISL